MKKLILILMVGSLFPQDVYPNFSDPKKQFQFERKRIYTKEVSEKEMIIEGGGSQFNPRALFNEIFLDSMHQPPYTKKNINFQYRYRYTFEISQNNKLLNELDFLYAVGLNEEAEGIIDYYTILFKEWNQNPTKTIIKSPTKNISDFFYMFGGLMGLAFFTLEPATDDGSDPRPAMCIVSLGLGYLFSLQKVTITQVINKAVLKQTLSSNQITAIANSYNRQLFEEIKSDN